MILHLDFESFSELDITEVGAYKYAMHHSTEVLMLGWAVDHDAPNLWVPAEGEIGVPARLDDLLRDPKLEIHAFNASFERLILWHVMQYNFLRIEQFRCSMTHAWSLSFAGNLGMVGAQLGLPPEKRKSQRGKQLIQKFCKPAPKNHRAERYDHTNAPQDWEEFKAYCIQDVIAEREIEMLLAGYPMPAQELSLWHWDQHVNDRGVPVDIGLVNAAVNIDREEKLRLKHEMNSVTYLENANSNAQLQQWLAAHGVPLENMQKETLKAAREETTDGLVKHVISMKLGVSKTSTTKWKAFQAATCDDGLLRGMFQFGGAQRTQRWAGRIVQLQNLKSPGPAYENTIAQVVDAFYCEDLPTLHTLFDDLLEVLSQGIRCAITAPDGYLLAPCDLGSIESRVVGYLSGCKRINRIFAEGKDTYKDFAMEMFRCAYEEVTKAQRKYCKPPVLGCAYHLGAKGLVEYAAGMGVTLSLEEAQAAVDLWRELYYEVPEMWKWLTESCTDVIEHHTTHSGYGVVIHRDQNFLMIELPSGRRIYYYQPLVLPMTPPWERDRIEDAVRELMLEHPLMSEEDARAEVGPPRKRPTITYMGMNQFTKQWERIATHGGKFTEQITQGIARDVLAFHMLETERQLGPIIRGHVHDEQIPLVPEFNAPTWLARIEEIMSMSPPWAPTLLLGAKGFLTKRYRKD